jgi:hypothetical protein
MSTTGLTAETHRIDPQLAPSADYDDVRPTDAS